MKDLKKPLVILMARVSSKQQMDKGYSIPAQMKKLRKYAGEKSLSILQTFEIDETASKSHARIQFSKLMDVLESAKDTGQKYALLVEKSDRLTRNMSDAEDLDELCEADFLEIHFVDEHRVWDKNFNCHDWFMESIFRVSAVYENKRRASEVAKGKKEKLAQGGYPGLAPVGYINNPRTRAIEPDPERFDLVKKCLTEIYPTGKYSLREFKKEIERLGLTTRPRKGESKGYPLTMNAVRMMITRRFYTGDFDWAGKIYSNKGVNGEPTYPIMITKAQYDRNQEILTGRCNNKKRKSRIFNFKGVLRCGVCGRAMLGHIQKNKIYYHCSQTKCGTLGFTEEELQKLFLDQLDSILPDEKAMKDLMKKLGDEVKILRETSQNQVTHLRKKRTELDQKIDRLYDNFDMEKISEDLFTEQYEKAKTEREEIQNQLDRLEEASEAKVESACEIIKLSKNFKIKYLESDTEKRNDMLKAIYKTVKVSRKDEDGSEFFPLYFIYNQPFDLLFLDGLDKKSRESETPYFEDSLVSYNKEL